MKYGVLLTFALFLLVFASSASAYNYVNTNINYLKESCYTCLEQRTLFIEQPKPDVIYRQNEIFGCVGCAETTIYRTIHLAAPRPEIQYSFVDFPSCIW